MPQNIGDNVIHAEGIARIQESDALRLAKYRMRNGDIVYSRRGDVEKRALVRENNEGWLCGTGCLRVRLGEQSEHSPAFVSYLLGTEEARAWIVRHAVGATMPNLNTSILAAVPLQVPEPAEQRAIAEVLGVLDDKIAANTKLSVTASQLMVSLLTPYPVRLPLSEIAVHRRRSANPESISVENVAHFSLPAFDTDRCPEVSKPANIKSNKFVIAEPSVLISKLNPRFPRIWDVATLPSIPALASTEFLVLEPKEESTAVIWAMLSQPLFSASLESRVSGTSSSHQRVKPGDVLATPVTDLSSVPTAVKRQISLLGSRVAATRVENATIAATRDALLPQLMSGKLRVKDAEKVLEDAGV
ncbi:restriction endonuclease subunit S [Arthrobacter sp. YN]|uniref:restriction endonuclease subunit S n=1 Tax=Arthrobacter sp. YN TaxID=2020486 RepID=UPI0018DF3A85|nr:restriction endonuclease subunit S [Arthrobacter sp. YN]